LVDGIERGKVSGRGRRGKFRIPIATGGPHTHRVERSYGSFVRTFTLPDNVDDTKVRADFKDGVLNVRLPKSEKAKPKAIEVKVG